MSRLTYTVSSDQLTEADIYEITPVSSLYQFLQSKQSLCIVHNPQWNGNGGEEMLRVNGLNNHGELEKVYLDSCSLADQGWLKNRLDKKLDSPFLFMAWKTRGVHTFRLIRQRETIAEYSDFESALNAYFPSGFTPQHSYRRKHNILHLFCLAQHRRTLFKELVTVLQRYVEKKTP